MKQPKIIASTLTVVAVGSGLNHPNALAEKATPEPDSSSKASDSLTRQRASMPSVSPSATPEQTEATPEFSQPKPPSKVAPTASQTSTGFATPPTIVPPEKLNPLITSTPVNNRSLSHQNRWDASLNLRYTAPGNTFTPNVQASYKLHHRAVRQIKADGLLTLDYQADYLLLDTPLKSRRVTVEVDSQVTTLGQHLQFSLMGTCPPGVGTAQDICNYSPGLNTDNSPEAADPTTQNPIQVILAPNGKGAAFDVVTPENMAAIQAPDFQQGLPTSDPRSQQIGNDITTPNLGIQDSVVTHRRQIEEIQNSPTLSAVRVRRMVAANPDRAQIAQTVRGISLITDLQNSGISSENLQNAGIMAAAQLIPDRRPNLKGTGEPASGAPENLFIAANSVRLPTNSFTAYHGGVGSVSNRPGNNTRNRFASFNSVWIGLSPLIDRTFQAEGWLGRLTRTTTLFRGGAEGGNTSSSAPNFDVLIINPDNSTLRLTPETLPTYYTQVYLDFFESTGKQYIRTVLNETTRYAPSVAFTGSFANQNHVFQYFAGAIVDPKRFDNSKAYVGAAYRGNNAKQRMAWSIEAQGVIAPDPDYYSFVSASVAKGWQLGKVPGTPVFFMSASGLYSFDRPRLYNNIGFSPINSLSLSVGMNFGQRFPLSLSVDYMPPVFGANGTSQTLTANIAFRFNERIAVSGFYTPLADSTSRNLAGARLDLTLGSQRLSPRFFLGWGLNQYDLSGRTLNDHQVTFGLQLGGN